MARIVALDFESYYKPPYSLKQMSTEAYIRDPQFEVIGCSISIGGQPAVWYAQPDVPAALAAIDWSAHSLLAFNTTFDGAILAWHYGHYPRLYLDAMGMARALGKTHRGGSLGKVLETCGLPAKGDYVQKVVGMRYADFDKFQLHAYGQYCCHDTDSTVALYRLMQPFFPVEETLVQDRNLRLFIEPCLTFNTDMLNIYRAEVITAKRTMMEKAAALLTIEWWNTEDELLEQLRKILASNNKFAEMLISLGVDPPTKISVKTLKETWAFAKTDEEFCALLEHEDPAVQALVAARLGTKSTIEETRAASFLDLATRGVWPVEYLYYGGFPGRFAGGGNVNPQNLKRGGTLRDAVMPPPGHYFLTGDLSQVEARLVNYLAGQDDMIEAFRLHDMDPDLYPDVYCKFASKLYGRTITRQDKFERQSGKVAVLSLGYGGGYKAYKRGMFKESGIVVPEADAVQVVGLYRETHDKVQELWHKASDVLHSLKRQLPFELGREGVLDGSSPEKGIGLPSGLYLYYPELRQEWDEKLKKTMWYYTITKKGRTEKKKIYGSVAVQNVIEGLGAIILKAAWLRIAQRGVRIVMHTHDELAGVVPYADVVDATAIMEEELTRPVPWAPGLPIMCEVKHGLTYGAAK